MAGAYRRTAAQEAADKAVMQAITTGLALSVDSLVPRCLPKAVRSGDGWLIGSIDGEAGQSMKIWRKTGIWKDYNPGGRARATGDMLHLVTHCLFAGNLADAIKWAKSELGLDSEDPARVQMTLRQAAEKKEQAFNAEQEETRKSARALWHGSRDDPTPDSILRTPALSYLTTRAIEMDRLGRVPRALRFRPDVWCPIAKTKRPAMLACIMGLDGALLGVHRTYLDLSEWDFALKSGPVHIVKTAEWRDATGAHKIIVPRGDAAPKGSKVKSHKLTLGRYTGGCIPLWKGACRKTLRDIDGGVPVFVSEGIEDGLSWTMANPDDRVVAGVALANIGSLELPRQAGPLTIIMQNDPEGSDAVASVERVIAKHQAQGRKVRVVRPPIGFKDFNDFLAGKPMTVAA